MLGKRLHDEREYQSKPCEFQSQNVAQELIISKLGEEEPCQTEQIGCDTNLERKALNLEIFTRAGNLS